VGAVEVFRSLQVERSDSTWVGWIFDHGYWWLIASVLLVTFLHIPNKASLNTHSTTIIVATYAIYIFFLEVTSRAYKAAYDRILFRFIRITANIAFISALIWINSGNADYFWFLYALPIFQAIIYLRRSGVIFVAALVIAIYWVIKIWPIEVGTQNPDYTLFVVDTIILLVFAFVIYGLFATAVESKRLDIENVESLHSTARGIMAYLDRGSLLEIIIKQAVELLHAKSGGIYEYDQNQGELTIIADSNASKTLKGKRLKVGEGMAGQVVLSGEPLIVDDYDKWPGRADYEYELFKAVVMVPLQSNDRILGALYVTDDVDGRTFAQRDAKLLSVLSAYAAIAIRNAELFEELQKNLTQMESLDQINTRISMELNQDEILLETLREGLQAIRAEEGSIMTVNRESETLEIKYWIVQGEIMAEKPNRELRLNEGIAGHVVSTVKSYNCPDTLLDPLFVKSFTGRTIRSLLSVPIASHGRAIYVFNADNEKPNFFNIDDEQFISALASRVAVAIQAPNLRKTELDLSNLPVDKMMGKIARSACFLTGMEASTIFLEDRFSKQINRATRFPFSQKDSLPRSKDGLTHYVLTTGNPIIITDAQNDDRVKPSVKERGVQAIIGVPLKFPGERSSGRKENGDMQTVGVLFVNTRQPYKYTKYDLNLLQNLAAHASAALENARKMEQLRRHTLALEYLQDTYLMTTGELSITQLSRSIIDQAVKITQARGGGIYLRLDRFSDQVKLIAVSGLPAKHEGMSFEIRNTLVGQAIKSKRHVSVPDYSKLEERIHEFDEYQIKAAAAVPISRDNNIYGAIAVHDVVEGREFEDEELDLLRRFANLASVALENAQLINERESLLKSSFDAIIAVDEAGNVTDFNEEAKRIFRFTDEEVETKVLGYSVVPLYWDEKEPGKIITRLLNEGGILRNHLTFVRSRDGERIPIRLSASLLPDFEGNLPDGRGQRASSVGFFRDMREIKEVQQLRSLYEASKDLTADLSAEDVLQNVLQNVVDAARILVEAKYGALAVPGRRGKIKFFKTSWEDEAEKTKYQSETLPEGHGILGLLLHRNEPIRVDNITKHESSKGAPADHPPISSFLGVPITTAKGEIIGSLYMANKLKAAEFTEEDQEILVGFGLQAATVIRNAQLYERELSAKSVAEVVAALLASEPHDSKAALHSTSTVAREFAECDSVTLYYFDPAKGEFRTPPTYVGIPDEKRILYKSGVPDTSIAYKMLKQDRYYIARDVATDPYFKDSRFTKEVGIKSCIAFPLESMSRRVGVMFLNYHSEFPLKEEDIEWIQFLANQAATAHLFEMIIGKDKVTEKNLRLITQLNEQINSSFAPDGPDLDKILSDILTAVTDTLGFEFAAIQLVDNSDNTIYTAMGKANESIPGALNPEDWKQIARHPLDPPHGQMRDIHAWLLREHKEAIIIKGQHPSFDPEIYSRHGHDKVIRAFVPIETKNRWEVVGTLEAGHNISRKSDIEPGEMEMLKALANQAAIAIRNYNYRKQFVESELLKTVPYTAHILMRPTANLVALLYEIKRKLENEKLNLDDLKKYTTMASRSAITAYQMSRTLAEEVDLSNQLKQGRLEVNLILKINLVEEVLKKIVELLQPGGHSFDFTDKHIELIDNLSQKHLYMTKLECTWLEIILLNLLVNAWQVSPPRGIIRVECSDNHPEDIILSVNDEGPGLSAEIPLFYAGSKTSVIGWPAGSGLGLYTVKKLVDQLGWKCLPINLPNHGARFEVHISRNRRENT
jgi:PAS domain S-box-containing protein